MWSHPRAGRGRRRRLAAPGKRAPLRHGRPSTFHSGIVIVSSPSRARTTANADSAFSSSGWLPLRRPAPAPVPRILRAPNLTRHHLLVTAKLTAEGRGIQPAPSASKYRQCLRAPDSTHLDPGLSLRRYVPDRPDLQCPSLLHFNFSSSTLLHLLCCTLSSKNISSDARLNSIMNGSSNGACSAISVVVSPVATVPMAMYPDSRASERTISQGGWELMTPRI